MSAINAHRGSKNDEKDDFWIAYILIGYQGPLSKDFDGASGSSYETAKQGETVSQFISQTQISSCDCYNSTICPAGERACVLSSGANILPRGGQGSFIFQEVNQDLKSYVGSLPPPYTARIIEEIEWTTPHELGHQFGLLGDQQRATFKIMDYSDYLGNVVNDLDFHPEHINIMRHRVKSPGE